MCSSFQSWAEELQSWKDRETEEKTVEFPLTWGKTRSSQLKETHLCITRALWDVMNRKGKGRWGDVGQEKRSSTGEGALTLGDGGGWVGGVRQLVRGESRHPCGREAPRQQVVESRKLVRPRLFAPSRPSVAEPHLMGRGKKPRVTRSCCPISPALLVETHPELQRWPNTASSRCLTQTLWVFVSVPQFPFFQLQY